MLAVFFETRLGPEVGGAQAETQAEAYRAIVEVAAGQHETGPDLEHSACAPEVFCAGCCAGIITKEGQALAGKGAEREVEDTFYFV